MLRCCRRGIATCNSNRRGTRGRPKRPNKGRGPWVAPHVSDRQDCVVPRSHLRHARSKLAPASRHILDLRVALLQAWHCKTTREGFTEPASYPEWHEIDPPPAFVASTSASGTPAHERGVIAGLSGPAPPRVASLSIIGFEDEMALEPSGVCGRREPRASSRHRWHLTELVCRAGVRASSRD